MASRAGPQHSHDEPEAGPGDPASAIYDMGDPSSRGVGVAIGLAALAVAWIAVVAWGLAAATPPAGLGLLRVAAWVGLACGPLALLAVLWLLLLRTGTVEARRYAVAAAGLRTESERVAAVLALLNRRIAMAQEELGTQATMLATLGDEAGARLARTGEALNAEARHLASAAATLDDATAAARTDMGVLLADLPGAQAQAREFGEHLRRVSEDAAANAATLETRLAAIEAQARSVDQGSAGAARRLAIELERIEGGAAAVDRRIVEATGRLESASDRALEAAAGSLDQVRRVVEEQGDAVTALLVHGETSFRDVGAESVRLLNGRLEGLATRFDAVGGRLRAHESNSRGLLAQLDQALAAIEARFGALGEHGAEQTAELAESLAALSDKAGEIGRTLGHGHQAADALIGRVQMLQERVEASSGHLSSTIPQALADLRLHADEGLRAITHAAPEASKMAADAEIAAARWVAAGAVMDRHGDATVALTGQVQALQVLLARIDSTFTHIAEGASTKLVDALLRVRETAGQAAVHAREALAEAVPQAAAALAEAGAREMRAKLGEVGHAEIAAVGAASVQATDVARAASERLTRQLVTLAETTQTLETRLAEHRAAVDADNEGGFARQIGLLIEALNSTAIDVGRMLSTEPTDTEWAAYLKGDRGIFTRRAVRLLEGGEARRVAQRYGDDDDFRDQVNRYVHDFEAMLRRVLSMRDGGPMGVALLSSDAGKLYVALAQAIERLRRS